MLPALFFVYMQQWHLGQLPYEYQDGILDAAAVHALFDSADPLARFAADDKLFGSLAGKAEFSDLLRQSVARVNQWLADAKHA
jgi:D-arabinitol 4-dehydrogenase